MHRREYDTRIIWRRSFVVITCLFAGRLFAADQLAFPGAEGFGRHSLGGRGGQVLFVTNLGDYIPEKEDILPGSFRAACCAKGSRTIIFRTSGTIPLKTALIIEEPFLTIAGQSAPGDGICLKDHGVSIATHDVVIQYLRVRPGDEPGPAYKARGEVFAPDGINVASPSRDVVIDHCSVSWSVDECLSVSGADITNVTIQWCLISESLDSSFHPKGPHGFGSLLRCNGDVSMHHNLYAHHRSRSPRPGTYGDGSILLDFRNNVIFNSTGYSAADPVRMNYVANYIKRDRGGAFNIGGVTTRIFAEGNQLVNQEGSTMRGVAIIRNGAGENVMKSAFPAPAVLQESAESAYESVLTSSGALLPKRDAVDRRVVRHVRTGQGDLIDSQREVGGWPELGKGKLANDRDRDGVPDRWEVENGMDPDSSEDANDLTAGGYTHLEAWLHSLTSGNQQLDVSQVPGS